MKRKIRLGLLLVLMFGLIISGSIGVTSERESFWKLSENVLANISMAAMGESSYRVKIASTLQKVGKNLILENTRGTKEINAYQRCR